MSVENMKKKLGQLQETVNQVPGVHIHDIRNFISGNISVNRKGELKITLTLPAKELMNNPEDVMDVIHGNWKVVPLLTFVEEDS